MPDGMTQPYKHTVTGTNQGGCSGQNGGEYTGACTVCAGNSCSKTYSCSSTGNCNYDSVTIPVTPQCNCNENLGFCTEDHEASRTLNCTCTPDTCTSLGYGGGYCPQVTGISDGCGGTLTCGQDCDPDEVCSGHACECVPDCAGKECGSDGCGGSCPPGCGWCQGCNNQGQCYSYSSMLYFYIDP